MRGITFCTLLLSTLLSTLAVALGADIPKPSGSSLVSSEAQLDRVFTRTADIQGGLTEGAAVAPDGSIYFSDIPFGTDRGMIQRYDPETNTTAVFTFQSGKSNGLIFDSDGNLLACEGSNYGGRRVSRWDVKTGRRITVADRYMGKRFNAPNDLCLDAQGRIYFSDPRYLGPETRELEHRAVYRIDTNGTVIEITHNVSKPNGIALSPNGRALYVADHDNGTDDLTAPGAENVKKGPMRVYAFPLGSDGTVSGPRRTLIDFGTEDGCDGMTIDAHGNLYLTARTGKRPGVLVINPNGAEVGFIPTGPPNQSEHDTPIGRPSNVEFGLGDEAHVLYITVDTSLFRIPLKVKGYHRQFAR